MGKAVIASVRPAQLNADLFDALLRTVRFILSPFINRLRHGEGGLVLFNALHSASAYPDDWQKVVAETGVALLALLTLYGFNDYVDRERDLTNAKKDQDFTRSIVEGHRHFIRVNLLLALIAIVLAFKVSGYFFAGMLLLLLAVNAAYSLRLKSMPIFDLVAVVVWGGLFVSISGRPDPLLAMAAGLMTGIAHVFQMMTDRIADVQTGVRTTVVNRPGHALGALLLLSALLVITLFYLGIGFWVLICVLPPVAFLLNRGVMLSWYVSRAGFLVLWVVSLIKVYGLG
jgi:4-hydroxybenzoate polyprenyltransferase